MRFLLGVIVGILGTLAAGTQAGSHWLQYGLALVSGGVDHASAQRAVSKYLFDPYSAQFDGLRSVTMDGQRYVCGYVNAKNKMGAYIGKHQFVYDQLIDIAFVDDDTDTAKILKERFQPCLPASSRTSTATEGSNTESVSENAFPKSGVPGIPLRPDDFPISTSKSAPAAAIPKLSQPGPPPSSPPQPATPRSAWLTEMSKSPVDDSPQFSAYLPGSPNGAALVLRCHERKIEAYFKTPTIFFADTGNRATVLARINEAQPLSGAWSTSTDSKALFTPSALQFLKSLPNDGKLFLRATGFQGRQQDGTFELADVATMRDRIIETCTPATKGVKKST